MYGISPFFFCIFFFSIIFNSYFGQNNELRFFFLLWSKNIKNLAEFRAYQFLFWNFRTFLGKMSLCMEFWAFWSGNPVIYESVHHKHSVSILSQYFHYWCFALFRMFYHIIYWSYSIVIAKLVNFYSETLFFWGEGGIWPPSTEWSSTKSNRMKSKGA